MAFWVGSLNIFDIKFSWPNLQQSKPCCRYYYLFFWRISYISSINLIHKNLKYFNSRPRLFRHVAVCFLLDFSTTTNAVRLRLLLFFGYHPQLPGFLNTHDCNALKVMTVPSDDGINETVLRHASFWLPSKCSLAFLPQL